MTLRNACPTPRFQDEEFAELLAEMERQMDDGTGDEDEDEDDEPPLATPADRRRVKEIAAGIAKRSDPRLSEKDSDWLQETPQSLPVILENFIAEVRKPGISPQDPSVVAYLVLLSEQLQFLRYRLDEGRSWPNLLLLDAQERMLDAAEQDEISQEAWMLLAAVLTESRVSVSEEMQRRLAEAGLTRDVDGLPQDLGGALGETLDMIASLNTTPFEILDGILGTGAIVPPEMRCFIATELALSGHASLREAVPLMLLEQDASVRRQAAQALTQTANPDSVSGTALRRMIAVRNWLPGDDRPQVDAAIRAVRLRGTEPTAWPLAPADLEVFASFVDGSAAQSIVFADRTGRKRKVGGLLLRHGIGIRDAWMHEELSRKEFAELMEAVTGKMGAIKVDRRYADQVIQHAIAAGLAAGHVPPPSALALAEALGAHDWHDRHLDIAAEASAEWQLLPEDVRRSDTSAALHRRAGDWLEQTPFFRSWYEGGPLIEKRYRKMAPATAVKRLLHEELEAHRLAWAEKFLLVALCCKASQDPAYRVHTEELLIVAKALTSDEPVASIPAMQLIADTSVAAASYRGW